MTGDEATKHIAARQLDALRGATVEGGTVVVPANLALKFPRTEKITFSEVAFAKAQLKGVTFDGCHFAGVDFSGCAFEDVSFEQCSFKAVRFGVRSPENLPSHVQRPQRRSEHPTFMAHSGPQLRRVVFNGSLLEDVEMRWLRFEDVEFREIRADRAHFRGSCLERCDFRYAALANTTFANAWLDLVDFYRSVWTGSNVFEDAAIKRVSFNRASLEGVDFRRDNLGGPHARILQQDPEAFREFLEWVAQRDSLEQRPQGLTLDRVEGYTVQADSEASAIYRGLSGIWALHGHWNDAAWAYRESKRMEARGIRNALRMSAGERAKAPAMSTVSRASWGHYLFLRTLDLTCGFGESLGRVATLLAFVVAGFALGYLLLSETVRRLGASPIARAGWAFLFSLGRIVGTTPKGLELSGGLMFAASAETLIGVLLVALFGFVLGNRIRAW